MQIYMLGSALFAVAGTPPTSSSAPRCIAVNQNGPLGLRPRQVVPSGIPAVNHLRNSPDDSVVPLGTLVFPSWLTLAFMISLILFFRSFVNYEV
jgi:hypothetical protein